MRRRRAALAGIALVGALAAVQLVALVVYALGTDDETAAEVTAPAERTLAAYEGVGAWVDLYDTGSDAGDPTVTPADVDDMAAVGVETLYLQVARDDPERAPGLHDPELAARFLVRAHQRGLRVVAWYVPRFGDVERDLAHLRAMADFSVLRHRFDGVAVDIEWTATVAEDPTRSARLVELTEDLRAHVGSDALGAIVMAPVHTDVVSPGFWPGFPWDELAPLYDAWLPMGYWTDRTVASGYRDAGRYTTENLQRLEGHLGGPAPVHAIGGVGEGTTDVDIAAFVEAVRAEGAIGASIYDWATFPADAQRHLSAALVQ